MEALILGTQNQDTKIKLQTLGQILAKLQKTPTLSDSSVSDKSHIYRNICIFINENLKYI